MKIYNSIPADVPCVKFHFAAGLGMEEYSPDHGDDAQQAADEEGSRSIKPQPYYIYIYTSHIFVDFILIFSPNHRGPVLNFRATRNIHIPSQQHSTIYRSLPCYIVHPSRKP